MKKRKYHISFLLPYCVFVISSRMLTMPLWPGWTWRDALRVCKRRSPSLRRSMKRYVSVLYLQAGLSELEDCVSYTLMQSYHLPSWLQRTHTQTPVTSRSPFLSFCLLILKLWPLWNAELVIRWREHVSCCSSLSLSLCNREKEMETEAEYVNSCSAIYTFQ